MQLTIVQRRLQNGVFCIQIQICTNMYVANSLPVIQSNMLTPPPSRSPSKRGQIFLLFQKMCNVLKRVYKNNFLIFLIPQNLHFKFLVLGDFQMKNKDCFDLDEIFLDTFQKVIRILFT